MHHHHRSPSPIFVFFAGYSDPYAVIFVENQQDITSTQKKTLNPKWPDKELALYVRWAMVMVIMVMVMMVCCSHISNGKGWVHLVFWDEDRYKAGGFLGRIDLP